MEKPTNRPELTEKIKIMKQALNSFEKAVVMDISSITDEVHLDVLKNGQLQKFEYTLELTWKTLKSYLYVKHGIDARSPKEVIREFGKTNSLEPKIIESGLEMIDDRNTIAHEYKDYIMDNVYPNLSSYLSILKKLSLPLLNK